MIDLIPMTDADLSALHVAVLAEVARRYALATAPAQIQTASAILAAGQHRNPGDPWVQPTGAHDAYALDDTVTRDGRLWRSLIPANVWRPGTGALWLDLGPADGSTPAPTAPAWVEGAAYTVGQLVTYKGITYRCVLAHTAWAGTGWTPDVSASLWVTA